MSIQYQRHTLDTLTDGTEPGGAPLEPVSTWAVDLVGYEEPTGEWAELLDHCRDLAKGLLDPASGFMTYAEKRDERDDDDAMAIARQGGERVYEQEQGFAPLVLQPGLLRNGKPNADAMMAAWLENQSPSTSLTTPDLPERRHWGDIDLGEQLEGVNPLDAEQLPSAEPDGLVWMVSQLMREGGISPSFGLDGVTVEDLEEDLGEQGAANYLAHLVEMQEHLLEMQQRERDHARACRGLHPLPPFRRIEWVEQKLDDGSVKRIAVGTPRSHPRYRDITQPWREQNLARKARFAARCDDGTRVPFDLHAGVRRGTMPIVPPRKVEPTRGRPADVLAYIERYLDPQPPRVRRGRPCDVLAFIEANLPKARPAMRPARPCPRLERWWHYHGGRIVEQLAAWGLPVWQLWREFEGVGRDALRQERTAFVTAIDDAYYVLKAGA